MCHRVVTKTSLGPAATVVFAIIGLFIAIAVGCAAAAPFQPNAAASNAASNTATASPTLTIDHPSVSLPTSRPANP